MTFFEQIFEILQAYYVRLFDIEYFAPQTHFKFQGIQSNRDTNCLRPLHLLLKLAQSAESFLKSHFHVSAFVELFQLSFKRENFFSIEKSYTDKSVNVNLGNIVLLRVTIARTILQRKCYLVLTYIQFIRLNHRY